MKHLKIDVRYKIVDHGPHAPKRIVLHSTESNDYSGSRDILGVAAGWQEAGQGLGAHFITDKDGLVGMGLKPTRVAWHVLNNNTGSIGIEQIGFARFIPKIWWHRTKQLHATAHIIAALSNEYNIPIRHDIDHGVAMHSDFHVGHTDPGRGYPLGHVLKLAREIRSSY